MAIEFSKYQSLTLRAMCHLCRCPWTRTCRAGKDDKIDSDQQRKPARPRGPRVAQLVTVEWVTLLGRPQGWQS